MDEFLIWIKNTQNMKNPKSINDVGCNLKRAQKILNENKIDTLSLKTLESIEEFKKLSMCCKSHVRRSIRLYNKYIESMH